MPKYKLIALILFTLCLGGCATIVANQIVSPIEPDSVGLRKVAELTGVSTETLCSKRSYCVDVQRVDASKLKTETLAFRLKSNTRDKIWKYKLSRPDTRAVKPLQNQLIILFAGYAQRPVTLAIHQQWLQDITGAQVFVVPGANLVEKFSFGRNFVGPVVSKINQLSPESVHIIGLSMGAIAALEVAQQIPAAKLHLLAPMTDFRASTKAVWRSYYNNAFTSLFVSEPTIDTAIDIILTDRGITADDIRINEKLASGNVQSYIYVSAEDSITPPYNWQTSNQSNINVFTFQHLNHFELLSMTQAKLLAKFASNLLGREVLPSETDIIGTLCMAQDKNCLKEEGSESNRQPRRL